MIVDVEFYPNDDITFEPHFDVVTVSMNFEAGCMPQINHYIKVSHHSLPYSYYIVKAVIHSYDGRAVIIKAAPIKFQEQICREQNFM